MNALILVAACGLALAGAAVSPGKPKLSDYYPDGNVPCVDASFTFPQWDIYDPMVVVVNYTDGGMTGDFGFSFLNTAPNISSNCVTENIDLSNEDGAWHACSDGVTTFQFNLTDFRLSLRTKWTCDNSPYAFTAAGSNNIAFSMGCYEQESDRGHETVCLLANDEVGAALSSPLAIAPTYPYPAYVPEEVQPRCPDRSVEPGFNVSSLVVSHHVTSTSDGAAPNKSYDLSFDLTSISVNQTVKCSVTISEEQDPFHRGRWVSCSAPSGDEPLGTVKSTSFQFDFDYHVLSVMQAWDCTDFDPSNEDGSYTAEAYLSQPLECGPPVDVAVTGGVSTTYNCTLGTTTFYGYEDGGPELPHTVYAPSCTMNSLNLTTLELQSYSLGGVNSSITVANPGSGDVYDIAVGWHLLTDGAWHDCGTAATPWQLVGCKYQVSKPTRGQPVLELGLQIQWYCDDRDPLHAVLFNATAAAMLPATTGANVEMKISSLTWNSTKAPMDRGPPLLWIGWNAPS